MKTRIGRLNKVKNENKKPAANGTYYSVLLKDGSMAINFLFTEAEIHTAYDRAVRNPEDNLTRSMTSYLLD